MSLEALEKRRHEFANIEGKSCLLKNEFETDIRQTLKKIVKGYPEAERMKNLRKQQMWTSE
jgi:hypothetical protein